MLLAVSALRNRLTRLGRRVSWGLQDVLYPPRCLGCGARTPGDGEAEAPLCASCLAGIERARPAAVQQRLSELPEAAGVFASAFALWRFDPDGVLRALQHALKYQNRPRYGDAAGRWMGDALRAERPHGGSALAAVVPVPLHRTRRLERGYNQSAQLARGVAERLDVPVRPDALARLRPTRSQTHLPRRARWQNVAGAFASSPNPPLTGPALLIDDVLTTGATATAAAQALRRNGIAPGVHLATLALAA